MRGLHIVVINPGNGDVEFAKVFDTYNKPDDFLEWIGKVKSPKNTNYIRWEVPDGTIICAACKDDCVSKMTTMCKTFFSSMGSNEIWNLEYR